ncbi:MAG: uL4 family ribosomal protein [Thermomicrobiales bacterium]
MTRCGRSSRTSRSCIRHCCSNWRMLARVHMTPKLAVKFAVAAASHGARRARAGAPGVHPVPTLAGWRRGLRAAPPQVHAAHARRMRRLAVRSALSAKVQDGRLTVISGLEAIDPKTKAMISVLKGLPESRSYLILLPEKNDAIERAAGNLQNVKTILASYANVRDILKYERLIVSPEGIETLEAILALPADRREPSVWKQARQAALAGEAEAGV